jgi:hypothetical protein
MFSMKTKEIYLEKKKRETKWPPKFDTFGFIWIVVEYYSKVMNPKSLS